MNIFWTVILELLLWWMIKKKTVVVSIWEKNFPKISYVQLKKTEKWVTFKTKKIFASAVNWMTENFV